MRDPDEHTAQQPAETLQVGPSRPPWFANVPHRWRRSVVAFLVFALGIVAGGGAVLWWQARPAPSPVRADEHAVELLLFEAVSHRTHPGDGGFEPGPLEVRSAFFLSGVIASTIRTIRSQDPLLDVRAAALPVSVSPAARFQSVSLEITVRDCTAATEWTPVDRPFTITWRDQFGKGHVDRAGDFDRSMARSLTRYVEAVCGDRLNR